MRNMVLSFMLVLIPISSYADQIADLIDDLNRQEQAPAPKKKKSQNTGVNCRTIEGIASVYGLGNGKGDHPKQKLASGGTLNINAMTAAMLLVPLHSNVTVINKKTGRSVRVVVNDKGPYARGRVIDLTPAAASAIGMDPRGLGSVMVKTCD